ncbi:hypothetical protein [Streptacidiphilus sp. P02-A3a]|uniref:hypothetical protein n=1 Tax=Streptacidiphilus sp. P02-A3a TaxID=2704468 RepID=UPI0015F87597|nr:hypothetical protein [Streptacidiphilus sp. P02-A3a]QMU72572.1 hypothetical protein GXP74_34310 [Streptacidiphilus sp. P02-A3a]
MCDNQVEEKTSDPGFPLPDPAAVPGCSSCAGHVESIRGARRGGNQSATTDQRVLMRRHIDLEHR